MSENKNPPKFVIGLGASAGGLEALEQFFDNAPKNSGAAFVVVMHLSRDFKSMLDDLLARHTAMKVEPAQDGKRLSANTVYVIQPNTRLKVKGVKLEVDERASTDNQGGATAVDVLFESIAESWGERGAAIVLSGSGSDGAKGIRSVRNAGGFTCAQAPETARFDPMPNAAIATEDVHAVEAPDQLAETVIEGLTLPIASRTEAAPELENQAMSKILDAVIGATTLRAEEYKHSTFARRVSRRMMALRLDDMADYAAVVERDPIEAQALSQELLIGVTEFFRDAKPFKTIRQLIIPQIIKRAHEERRPIRMWIAGCATGQEVYSIAILFLEVLKDMPFEIDVQLFASDISRRHIDIATRGAYSPDQVSSIPRSMLERYFDYDDEQDIWTVVKRLRKMVVFAVHDLLSDPPFTKLDMVCCRNVLIYFSLEAQQRILGGFAFGLRPGGFLFLGSSETVGGQREVFEFVEASQRIFRRNANSGTARLMQGSRQSFPVGTAAGAARPSRKSSRLRSVELQPAYSALLDIYAPAGILFSGDRQLLHVFRDANRFLKAPTGIADLDVAELVDPALKSPIIVAIERGLKEDNAVSFNRIKLASHPEEGMLVDLTVRPLPSEANSGIDAKHFLAEISACEEDADSEPVEVSTISAGEIASARTAELEEELARTREALQSTIEEIETTNEELQSSNEELMSANEELQSTNEELSSVNEELYTVNAEYHRQNDELTRLAADFDLLLDATQIGVLFLDEDTRITRFTGLTRQLFKLEESDIGRSATSFAAPFADFDLADLVNKSRASKDPVEFEGEDRTGRQWLVRVVTNDAHFGVVFTFIDISALHEAEAELKQSYRMLDAIREQASAYYFEADADFSTIHRQVGFANFIGVDDIELPFKLPYDNVHPDDLKLLRTAIADGEADSEGELIYRMKSAAHDEYRYVRVRATRMSDGGWQIVAVDVDDLYNSELELREQAAILQETLVAGRSLKAYIKADRTYGFANENYCALLGKTPGEVIGRPVDEIIPPALLEMASANIDHALGGQERDDATEVTLDGEKVLLSVRYRPVIQKGNVLGFVFDGINVSALSVYAAQFAATDRLLTSSLRNSGEAFALVDPATCHIHFANSAAYSLLGLSQGEFSEGKFSIYRMTPEIGEKGWKDALERAVISQRTILNDTVILDGAHTTSRADLFLESDKSRDDGGFVSVRVVVNPPKQQLLEDLKERSVRLASSNRDLEQFTSVVAHDLRAPLRHITSFSEMLANGESDLSEEDSRSYAEIIGKSAKQLGNMVSGLLDYARMGLRDADMAPCAIEDVVEAAKRNLSEEITAVDADVQVNGSATITGNEELLLALFQNLIGNGVKYRREDVAPDICIDIIDESDAAWVIVADNGIGIDPEFSDKIFELFRRLHRDTEYSGMGIGLATCRKIAELHKADIRLDESFEGGSRFKLGPLAYAEAGDV